MENFMQRKIFFLVVSIIAAPLFGQVNLEQRLILSGSLALDSKMLFQEGNVTKTAILPEVEGKKTPILAGIMSLVIPGSGEIYTGHYYEGAVFLAIDAAAISLACKYNLRGNHQTIDFQNFADQNWSVVRYAEWIANRLKLDPAKYIKTTTNPNGWIDTNSAHGAPWQRVNWTALNAYEDSVQFSHQLAPYGDQQYYELVGKYHEFNAGWVTYTGGDDYYNNTPAIVYAYENMRGNANSSYNVSAKWVIAIYINHVLSAANALWDAISYNKNLKVETSIERKDFQGITEFVPTLKMQWHF
jgi:hypothetical protein